jgi:aerobic-type carbon monoxide dehydrogenase small subunit (CoxS/CutS family)
VEADFQAVGSGTTEASEQLLYWLREQFGQRGPRFGCGIAQCGACTVLLNGAPNRSCVTQLHTVADGAAVRTLDGLTVNGMPHALQNVFNSLQAGQCSFCVNAVIMGSLGWLEGRAAAGNRAAPTEQEVEDFFSAASPDNSTLNYICRCGTHTRIIAAVSQVLLGNWGIFQ